MLLWGTLVREKEFKMDIILATRNTSKAEQVKALFAETPHSILTMSEAGIRGEVVQTGLSIQENSLKKARFITSNRTSWVIADDTGLYIDALDGKPGALVSKWCGDGSTEERMQHVLEKLKAIEYPERKATFATVATMISPQGEEYVFQGEVRGIILTAPRCSCLPHLPFSAIFQPEGQDKTWAQMTNDEQNAISHRGQAFRKAKEYLSIIMSTPHTRV